MQNMRWAERLLSVLAERGLTQVQFARRLGKSQATVSRWITEASIPRIDVEQRIADELGVSREWLMTGQGEKELKRVCTDKKLGAVRTSTGARRSLWRYESDKRDGQSSDPAENVRISEMLSSVRLLIGDHTDLQIIARVHETLDDKNFSMSHRLLLVQALLDELHHRHSPSDLPAS